MSEFLVLVVIIGIAIGLVVLGTISDQLNRIADALERDKERKCQ